MLIGAAVTQEELIDKLLELTSASSSKLAAATSDVASTFMGGFRSLWGGASSGAAASSADPKHVWLPIAKHLQRIAGNQARPYLHAVLLSFWHERRTAAKLTLHSSWPAGMHAMSLKAGAVLLAT